MTTRLIGVSGFVICYPGNRSGHSQNDRIAGRIALQRISSGIRKSTQSPFPPPKSPLDH